MDDTIFKLNFPLLSEALGKAKRMRKGPKQDAAIKAAWAKYPLRERVEVDWVALNELLDRANEAAWDIEDIFLREGIRYGGYSIRSAVYRLANGHSGRGGVNGAVHEFEEFLNRIKEHYHTHGTPAWKLYDDAQFALREIWHSDDSPVHNPIDRANDDDPAKY